MIFKSSVALNIKKQNLIDYLAQRFTYLNNAQWAERVRAGKIHVNGKRSEETDSVYAEDVVAYDAGDFEEPCADLNYTIDYEDQWILGVNKPGNLLVHRAGRSFRNNLIYQLRKSMFPQANAVHRLDRETSGMVIVAKNREAMSCFAEEFRKGNVQKVYRAVVHGKVKDVIRQIEKPILKDKDSSVSHKFKVGESGKPAVTEILQTQPIGENASLLKLRPLTGRTHQIRVHLVSEGHPVIGDKLYSLTQEKYLRWLDDPKRIPQELLIKRQALHCESLRFTHPFTNKEVVLSAPVADDMKNLIRELGRKDSELKI